MKRAWLTAVAIAIVGVLTVGAATAPAAKHNKKKAKKVTCTAQLTEQAPPGQPGPNPAATQGTQFGTVSCAKPINHGVQSDSYTVTRSGPTTGTVTGPFTEYFDTGTVHGTFKLAYTATSTAITFTGNSKVTGGTGTYKHLKGHGPINCTSSDGGVHTSCKSTLIITHK
jgi:hypothetical protein